MIRKTGVRFLKSGLLLVLSLAVVTLTQAQPHEALHDDAWALQFSVTSDFTLAAFQGAMISAKHHMAPDRALRYGLSLGGQFQSVTQNEVEQDQNTQQLMLAVQYVGYPEVDDEEKDIYLYMGAGPELRFIRQHAESGATERTDREWGLAVGGLIGAEWFVRSRLSLMAEYGAGFGVTRFYTSEADDGESTSTMVGLSSRGVRFGVTVYVR